MFRKYNKIDFVPLSRCWDHCKKKTADLSLFIIWVIVSTGSCQVHAQYYIIITDDK